MDFIDEQIKHNLIEEDIELDGSYIKIWRNGYLVFISDVILWKFNSTWDDCFWDICDLLNDLADGKEIPEWYEVERTFTYNDSSVLKCVAEEVHDYARDLFDKNKN